MPVATQNFVPTCGEKSARLDGCDMGNPAPLSDDHDRTIT